MAVSYVTQGRSPNVASALTVSTNRPRSKSRWVFPAARLGGPRRPRQGHPPAPGSPPPERALRRHRNRHPLHNRDDCSQRPHSLKCLPFYFTISQEMRGQGISIPVFPSGQDRRGPVVFPVARKKTTKKQKTKEMVTGRKQTPEHRCGFLPDSPAAVRSVSEE